MAKTTETTTDQTARTETDRKGEAHVLLPGPRISAQLFCHYTDSVVRGVLLIFR